MYTFILPEEGKPTMADSCPHPIRILCDVKVNFVLIVLLCKFWSNQVSLEHPLLSNWQIFYQQLCLTKFV
jgi:hypothetical protein